MTDATDFSMIPRIARETPASINMPAPVLAGAPVLISDCVNPLAGETLLSLLWKHMDKQAGDDP